MTTFAAILTAACSLAAASVPMVPPGPEDLSPLPIEEEEGPMVEAMLWVERETVGVGEVFWVGVTFKIRPEWHVYWPGLNDTGMPPSFDWRLPEGWLIGQPRWPAPERYESSGGLIDHVLEGAPTVLFPVKVPEGEGVATSGTLSCDIEWLVCRSICVAEQQRVQFTMAAADWSDPTPRVRVQDSAAIAMARKELPAPLASADPPVVALLEGDTLVITAAGGAEVIFAPASSGRPIAGSIEDCRSGDGVLRVPLDARSASPVLGVVTVKSIGTVARSYDLRIPAIPDRDRDGFTIPESRSKP